VAEQFKYLFSPIKVGNVTVPNRIVVPGHFPALRDQDTLPGDREIAYWESKAKGGVGMLVTGIWGVHASSPTPSWREYIISYRNITSPLQLPRGMEKLKRAADTIKRHGTVFIVQLWHGGASAYGATMFGDTLWAPSSVVTNRILQPLHEMTKDEIKEVVEAFAAEALRCKKAGVDGVDIHGAHGYLLTQFMSSVTNKRTDEYGGDVEGRMRFPLEVIDAVRSAVGSDFVVGIRVTADLGILAGEGYTLDDMKIMAAMMARTGKIDYITTGPGIPPMYFPPNALVYQSAGLKEAVDIPVVGGGRINDPIQAEKILADGLADLLFMNRATICDPEMPKKAREGRLEEIRHCTGCSEGCWQRVAQDRNVQGISCAYNPTAGKETLPGWLELIPAKTKKRVMVIGGGPAGLETARVAAARGHQVSLWEKGSELGGTVLIASKIPARTDLDEIPRYYRYQMKLLGVNVHLDSEVTVDTVMKEKPDVVVVATGSLPRIPEEIKGVDQDNVVNVRDILTGKAEAGQNVLIVDYQRHIQGLGTADFLAQQGKKVEVLTPDPQSGVEVEALTRMALMLRLSMMGVKLSPGTALKEISGNTVTVTELYTRQERVIEGIDTIVLSYGGIENNELYYALKGKVKELHAVGDCKGVRKIMWATNDGATLAREI
jgi:2,4-dienoyl-CoA reductase-like NADH-dependent reductase (Old Yellow Enzyme family)/thioredoxin reductase